jgi:hypothetical protein
MYCKMARRGSFLKSPPPSLRGVLFAGQYSNRATTARRADRRRRSAPTRSATSRQRMLLNLANASLSVARRFYHTTRESELAESRVAVQLRYRHIFFGFSFRLAN